MFIFMLAGSVWSREVILIKQWHLRAKQDSRDINKSKSLLQFKSQRDIYRKVVKLINGKKSYTLISEGCEGSIGKDFTTTYNGWNYKKLQQALKSNAKSYEDILTLLPLKIKAKYKDINVVCGDDHKLIKENQLAFSDLRAYVGYLERLRQFKGKNSKKFNMYAKAMLEDKFGKVDPVTYAQKKSREAVAKITRSIHLRNDSFIKKIRQSSDNVIVIIGGMHVEDMGKKLKKLGMTYKVVVPQDYYAQEQKIFTDLKKYIAKPL